MENEATYCPEDNKLRLYVGRVPRDEYLKLRAEGWKALPKQREAGQGDFAATWTPARRDTALEYAGFIGDEDTGPAERAADRAQRFGGYRDKRTNEATGQADSYDAGPSAHGYQSQARAERAAARHDRAADRACDSWSKAEYWTSRTAGVISHALHKSTPAVRMGRIKIIEAELRKDEKTNAEHAEKFETWRKIAAMTDPAKQTALAERFAGCGYSWTKYTHPRTGKEGSLWDFLREDAADRITGAEAAAMFMATHIDPLKPEFHETSLADWIAHHKLRLAYENQMCEAEGGRAALVEMVPGGFIGNRQILKVNKSAVTGLVVSVAVAGKRRGFTRESDYKTEETRDCVINLNIERAGAEVYRAPTAEEAAKFAAERKAAKDARPKVEKPPLINPTEADAQRLQDMINAKAKAEHDAREGAKYGKDFEPVQLCKVPQAVYSQNSKGSYARAEVKDLCGNGEFVPPQRFYNYSTQASEAAARGPVVCQVRTTGYDPLRIVVIIDKPQKPLPAAVWEVYTPPPVAPAGPSEEITCSACGRTTERANWETGSNALFAAAITCPVCQMMHAATNENKTGSVAGRKELRGMSRGLSYSLNG